MNCQRCNTPLGADADPRRKTCSLACRQEMFRRRRDARSAAARDLLQRQTDAVIAGDTEALTALAEEARRLLA